MFKSFTINLRGRLMQFERPAVMGIINVTPDSFYSSSRFPKEGEIKRRVAQMVGEGVDIIDVGGYSTRPGACDVDVDEEIERVGRGIEAIKSEVGNIPISVDTFRSKVADIAIRKYGADIVNDISGGEADEDMFRVVAQLKVPYIIMHSRGNPVTMQNLTNYDDVVADVAEWHQRKVRMLAYEGVSDVIVDPGLGFAKNIEQNYSLLRSVEVISEITGRPVLIGLSRKSMITEPLGITTDDALSATTALNLYALNKGASIIRVHDVKEARQAVELFELLR